MAKVRTMVLRVARNGVLVAWLLVSLVSVSVAATTWAAVQTWKVAQLAHRTAEMAYQHRREMARAIAKARLRRLTTAIPVVGTAAAVYFERQSYQEWQALYPEGTAEDYACDMAGLTAEALDAVLQDLPEIARPSEQRVRGFLPDCAREDPEITP
jgi:hypothetical protein